MKTKIIAFLTILLISVTVLANGIVRQKLKMPEKIRFDKVYYYANRNYQMV